MLISLFACNALAQENSPALMGPPDPSATEPPQKKDTTKLISNSSITEVTDVELPQIEPGQEISLAEALDAADKRNMTLASIRVEIEKAEAQLGLAWALVFPAVQANMQYMHNDHADNFDMTESLQPMLDAMGVALPPGVSGAMVLHRQENLNGTIQARLPLINLQSWKTISMAKQGVDLATLGVEEARQQLLLETAQAYFVTAMMRSLIGSREEALDSAARHLDVAKAHLDAGMGVRIDVVRAETDLEQARRELIIAHLILDNARDALGLLTGLGGLPMPADDAVVSNIRNDENELDEDKLVDRAVNNRGDIELKRKTIGMMEKQLEVSWMQFLPSLDVAGQFQYQFTEPAELGSTDRSRWAVLLTLSVPIYNKFRYADLDLKRASLKQAILQKKDVERSAAIEVRKARRNYLTALSSVVIAERQEKLVREALSLVEESYSAGTGTSLEVTDARRNLSALQVGLATQRLKAQISLLALLRSLGEDMSNLAGQGSEK
jgi:outer membrane protein TolC